jgi:hypothetical protein
MTPRIFQQPVQQSAKIQLLTGPVGMTPVTPRDEGDFKPVG